MAFLLLLIMTPMTSCGGSDDNGNTSGDDTPKTTTLKAYTPARTLAFPGADGGASTTATGGAAGDVYVVTSLEDGYQQGTLRSALSSGKRTIVFAVAGQIDLQSKLTISISCLYQWQQHHPALPALPHGRPEYRQEQLRC